MDTSKPILSGTAALIVGTIGGLLAAASPFIPAPWATLAALVGFLACTLAGLAAKPPAVTEGKPVLQGTALTAVTAVAGLLTQFYGAIPAGWPQSIALGLMGLLAWLTGHAMPALGTVSPAVVKAADDAGVAASAKVDSTAAAVVELNKGPPAP